MARGTLPQIVRTYEAEGGAIGAGVIVVWGTSENQVKLPGAADAGAIVGITLTAAAAAGDQIEVVRAGSADLVVNAAGTAIVKGDPIAIHGVTGRGKKSDLTNAKHVLGYAEEPASADAVSIAVEIHKFSTPSA